MILLNGTDQGAYRDNVDVKNLLQYGRKVVATAVIDALPGAGQRQAIFAFDWLPNLQQHFVLYVDENGKIVLRAHSGSSDFETISSNAVTAGVEFTVEARIDNATPDGVFNIWLGGTQTQETKTNFVTSNWRYDLCERLSIGFVENNAEVKSSFFDGGIEDAKIYDTDGVTLVWRCPLDTDANDVTAGARHLTLWGSPTFDGGGGGGGLVYPVLEGGVLGGRVLAGGVL